MQPIGLLLDSINDNTGDKAIRLVMEDFFDQHGILYQLIDPRQTERHRFQHVVVGGGDLLRDKGEDFYDAFRIKGKHILNCVGISTSENLAYLDEYIYLSVRSAADRKRLIGVTKEVRVVPCVSLKLRPSRSPIRPKRPTIGVHLHSGTVMSCPDIARYLKPDRSHNVLFLPFTHYENDYQTMLRIAPDIEGSKSTGYLDPRELLDVIRQLDVLVCSSLHAALFAYAMNIPFLVFPSAENIDAFMEERGLSQWMFRTSTELQDRLQAILHKPPDYSTAVKEDLQTIDEHFHRLRGLLSLPVWTGVGDHDQQNQEEKDHTACITAARDKDRENAALGRTIDASRNLLASLESMFLDKERHIRNLQAERDKYAEVNAGLEKVVGTLAGDLNRIKRTLGWRLLSRYGIFKYGVLLPALDRLNKTSMYLKRLLRQPDATDPYEIWVQRSEAIRPAPEQYAARLQSLRTQPIISLLMPVLNPRQDWLEETIESATRQFYARWELCICDDGSAPDNVKKLLERQQEKDPRVKFAVSSHPHGASSAANCALSMATGEFVALLNQHDRLAPNALAEVVKSLQEHPADIIYTDEDAIDERGKRRDPKFKPDWSPDLILSYMYTGNLGIYRRALVEDLGGFRLGFEGSQDYDLVLRLIERTERIVHVPRTLYHSRRLSDSRGKTSACRRDTYERSRRAIEEHLCRRGIQARVEDGPSPTMFGVRRQVHSSPTVSILIPTKDRADLLRRCLESVDRKTTYRHFEILIIDNGSTESKSLAYLRSLPHRIIRDDRPFNFSRLNNLGAAHATGEFLLLLNNDTEVITPDWLSAMLEHAQRPEVGIVGSKLLYSDGSIQHAGVLLGIGGMAGHSHKHLQSSQYYHQLPNLINDCSAVTGACLMIRSSLYGELGGMDEQNLPVAFGDIDLCLRVRERGYLVVYTPYSMLYHHESKTRGYTLDGREHTYFINRWSHMLGRDPYYNPNLTAELEDFSIDWLKPQGTVPGVAQLSGTQSLSELLPGRTIGQSIKLRGGCLVTVCVRFDTYKRTNHCTVRFHLRASPENQEDLATVVLDASTLPHGQFFPIDFRPIETNHPDEVYFFFDSPDASPGNAVSLLRAQTEHPGIGTCYIDHRPDRGCLTFRTYQLSPSDCPHLRAGAES
jgi:GT2 family glycosyltransferase